MISEQVKLRNDIIEGNQLISEILGRRNDENMYTMKYHSSWDFLMLAVDLIETSCDARVAIYPNNCFIEYELTMEKNKSILVHKDNKTKILMVWKAVVEFLKVKLNFYESNQNI